jgi:GntR family uxuAB operon transcriptional repressor
MPVELRDAEPNEPQQSPWRILRVPLQAVEAKRLYRQIADQIAGLIAKGEFTDGSRLPAERELASQLGVSRASVREAIISLEIAGLVEVRVGTGIFVKARTTPATAQDGGPGPFDLLNARKLVEGEIAARAAKHATAADVDALRACLERMDANVDNFAIREEADRDFHFRIAKATGNGSLELVVEGMWEQRAELWGRLQKHFHTRELAQATVRDHAAIVKAIAAHDADGARSAMHRHMARVVKEFQRGLDDAARADEQTAPRTRGVSEEKLASSIIRPAPGASLNKTK